MEGMSLPRRLRLIDDQIQPRPIPVHFEWNDDLVSAYGFDTYPRSTSPTSDGFEDASPTTAGNPSETPLARKVPRSKRWHADGLVFLVFGGVANSATSDSLVCRDRGSHGH